MYVFFFDHYKKVDGLRGGYVNCVEREGWGRCLRTKCVFFVCVWFRCYMLYIIDGEQFRGTYTLYNSSCNLVPICLYAAYLKSLLYTESNIKSSCLRW